jgi:hypothetical protein
MRVDGYLIRGGNYTVVDLISTVLHRAVLDWMISIM